MNDNDVSRQQRLRQALIGQLESLERAGVLDLPRPRGSRKLPLPSREGRGEGQCADTNSPAALPVDKSLETCSSNPPKSLPQAPAPAATLEILQQEVAGCTRCDELARTRTQTVFGVGDPRARLCFLGEAPGADEDRLGEPFVGRAGQLLDKIIEACRMKREDVYICNILKCRPPGNRNPLPDEAANCRYFLDRQLELVGPEFICCLGAVAAQNLLGTPLSIGKLRGKLHAYRGAKVVCTYHPAYLLRNPAAKKDTWEDMKFLMREMGVEL